MDFKYADKEFRPVPFWSWNEKLAPSETREQVRIMDKAGIGGFFMHARGGLQTEYMSDEWFENVDAAVDEAKKCGMYAWAYDENGWPSGFGGGVVNALGIRYQQKYLRMSDSKHSENSIGKCGEHWFYYDVNKFYVDTLDAEVIREFIKSSYEPYYEKYKNDITGFFTDEPQISRNGIPWSFVFEKEYCERYNENITDHLEELFLPVGDYKNTRVKFWRMVTELFSINFCKQIYDWCDERGLKLTGHLVLEENLLGQIVSNGACMPSYEFFHIPGMDWLGRKISPCLTTFQLSSVAQQFAKEKVLSETFALSGHNISFDELKGMFEWQLVHGANILCPHLEGYSLRGIRKRDYPPAMYYQQPWWEVYDKYTDAMSRVGMVLSKGEIKPDILLIHPQTTAWTLYDDKEKSAIWELNDKFQNVIGELEKKHVLFHLGDETIMKRHAKVLGDKIQIGVQTYSYVLNPCGEILFPETEKLLNEFKQNGGKIISLDEVCENNVIDNDEITYTFRKYDDFCVHYFVNTSDKFKKAHINVCGQMLDIFTGDLKPFDKEHEFEPWGSIMIIENGNGDDGYKDKAEDKIYLPDKMELAEGNINVLTLDRCDYYFDGKLEEENGYVLNIVERANALERPVHIKQVYHINVKNKPEKTELALETPEKFQIRLNGNSIGEKFDGWFRDKSFKKTDISNMFKEGENILEFECDFCQSEEFYKNLKNSYIFESEKNKLVYDMEIEAVYLLGDFSVLTDGKWSEADKYAEFYDGGFVIDKPKSNIEIKHIEKQGYPFFSGNLSLFGKINIHGENPVLMLNRHGVNAVKIEIGGMEKTIITTNKIPLSDFGVKGLTDIKLTLINNLRNMLGPHHLKCGECFTVCPSSFFKEPCVWNENPKEDWDDRYCFVETSI